MNWTRTRLTIQAWFELALYDGRITRGGFRAIHRRLAKQCVAKRRAQSHTVAALCDAVNLSACFYFKPVRCLQRAVVTTRLLRKHGIAADLVIAYRPSPFFSHAWVEVDGQIVNDSPAYAEQLMVLYRQQSSQGKEGRA
jgi:hypothetical protein